MLLNSSESTSLSKLPISSFRWAIDSVSDASTIEDNSSILLDSLSSLLKSSAIDFMDFSSSMVSFLLSLDQKEGSVSSSSIFLMRVSFLAISKIPP